MNLTELLQNVPEFSTFKPAELDTLERALCVTTYRDGHTFIQQGKRADKMYLIVEGSVKVTRTSSKSVGFDVNKTLGRGEIFGLVSMLDQGPSTATCRAEGEAVVATLPHTAFDMLVRTQAPISNHFKELVSRQLARDVYCDYQTMVGLVIQSAYRQIRGMVESQPVCA